MSTTAKDNVVLDEAKTAFEAFLANVKEAVAAFLAKLQDIVYGILGISVL